MGLQRLPVIALLIGCLAALMLIPASHALLGHDWRSARAFLFCALFCFFVAGALSFILKPMSVAVSARGELLALLGSWVFLPFFACLPLLFTTPWIGFGGAYFEMMADLTTTGGTVFANLERVPPSVHLWRGLVGWMGGLLTLLAAYVVMAPRKLGGFEVDAIEGEEALETRAVALESAAASYPARLWRAARTIIPIYLAMTVILGLLFNTIGKPGLLAAVHAMSVLSTSGISPLENGLAAEQSFTVEFVCVFFMVLAASRIPFARAARVGTETHWRHDPELRMMGWVILGAVILLFAHHWYGAISTTDPSASGSLWSALWGIFFTSLSFITTTGFESYAWESARDWSGLSNPGLMLMGLCMIGGGAATTAGGIKLIRAYVLLRHGLRELERIAQPHSAAGTSSSIRREGAFIAWAFMMLFVLALFAFVLLLSGVGMPFDAAMAAAIAALSNTGPVYSVVIEGTDGFSILKNSERVILSLAMVVGRVETLAIIALIHPDSWAGVFTRGKKAGKMARARQDSLAHTDD